MATGAGPHLPIEVDEDIRQEVGDIAGFEKRHDQTHRGMDGNARKEAWDKQGVTPTGHMRRNENL